MQEVFAALPAGALVLDPGSASGSFSGQGEEYRIVALDLDRQFVRGGLFVQGDASRLPFRAGAFDAKIANHSFEHFADLEGAVCEVQRVLKSEGLLYVAVPDANTVSDRLYRWIGGGGGHAICRESTSRRGPTFDYGAAPEMSPSGCSAAGCGGTDVRPVAR